MLQQKKQSTIDRADYIFLRRQLLDWRDKHVEAIQHHLNRGNYSDPQSTGGNFGIGRPVR